MKKRYFFKSQSSLQRKAIAGGLTATFAFGTVGSGFAGAMNEEKIIILEDNNEPKHELKHITLKEITVEGFDVSSKDNLDFIKKIDDQYEDLEEKIFGDGARMRVRMNLNVDDIEKFDETWKNFPHGNAVVFNFLISKRRPFDNSPNDTLNYVMGNFDGHFCTFLLRNYKKFFDSLNNCKKVQPQVKSQQVIVSAHSSNDIGAQNSIMFGTSEHGNDQGGGTQLNSKVDTINPQVNSHKKNLARKIILGIVAGVFLILAISLIVYFTVLGDSKQKTNETANPGNGNSNGNQTGDNGLNPANQQKDKEKSEVKQDSSIGAKILKGSVASAMGTGLATSGTYLYNKISSEGKDPEKQKAQNGNKEKDNKPYTYIDSAEKVITKTEEKNDSSNIANADTDISDTEQSPDSSGAENSKREKAENEDDIKDENA